MSVLLLVLASMAGLGLVVFAYARKRTSDTGSARLKLLALIVLLPVLVFVAAGAINTATDGRAAPEETSPWLALGAILFALAWAGRRRGWLRKGWPSRTPGASDHDLPARAGSESLAQSPNAGASAAPALIFISYRRHDSGDIAGRIFDRLVRHFPRESIFKDVDSIPLGVDFRQHLGDSVRCCRVVITVIGRSWLAAEGVARAKGIHDPSDFVRIENETAFACNIPVIPVLVQGAEMPREEELPESLKPLAYRNGIAIRPDPDFHQDMGRLIRGLEAYLPAHEMPRAATGTKPPAPA